MSLWFLQHENVFTVLVAYIPLIATVVTTALSIVLARATLRYSEATDKSLALAREEFDRQWSPELHIKLAPVSARSAKIVVTNLARISVLMQMVQLRKLSMAVPALRYFLNEPLVGGTTWTDELGTRLFACTGDEYDGVVAASITFYCSGRLFRTDWFRFHVHIRKGEIVQLDPVNIAAQRVRVLVPRNGHGNGNRNRRGLVKDVVRVGHEPETPEVRS
jgi:hypothetical protein